MHYGYHDGTLYYECGCCGGTFARADGRKLECLLGEHSDACCHFGEDMLFAGVWDTVRGHGPAGSPPITEPVVERSLRLVR